MRTGGFHISDMEVGRRGTVATELPAAERLRRKVDRQIWSYVLLMLALTSNGLFFSVDGMKVTPARAVGFALLFLLFLRGTLRGRINFGGVAGAVLLAWLLLSFGVDATHSTESILLRHWVNIAAGATWFYIVVTFRPRWEHVEAAAKRVALLLGASAVLALSAKVVAFDPLGLTSRLVPNIERGFRLVLLSWEPNIFGAIVATLIMLMLPRLTIGGKSLIQTSLLFVLLIVALIGALSKGPWLAFSVGLAAYLVMTLSRRVAMVAAGLSGASIIAVMVMLVTIPSGLVRTVAREHNIVVRLTHIHYALRDVATSPIWGHGTFSLDVMWPNLNERFGSNIGAWTGLTVVGVLHDTGVFGLALFIGFWGALFGRAILVIFRYRRNVLSRHSILFGAATVAAGIVLLAMGLATTLYALPVYWAVMGLVACVPGWVKHDCIDGVSACA